MRRRKRDVPTPTPAGTPAVTRALSASPALSPTASPAPTAGGRARDLIAAYGNAAVGGRLRRISERIDRESRAVYKHLGLEFEQRWVGVLIILLERQSATVGELAEGVGITQPSMSQTLRSLQAAKLVSSRPDPGDPRRRIQRLTKAGEALVNKARPVWEALIGAARELDDIGIDLVTPLERLEDELDKESILDRALRHLSAAAGKSPEGQGK